MTRKDTEAARVDRAKYLVFNKRHLTKVLDTLKFKIFVKNKTEDPRTPYMHLEISANVKEFTEEEKWLLDRIIKLGADGTLESIEIGECDPPYKIDINDPGIFD